MSKIFSQSTQDDNLVHATQPGAELREELVLEISDLKFHEENDTRRVTARARLVYEPATPGQPSVHSAKSWRFMVPTGPIEAAELKWYLESYAISPGRDFISRAEKVEKDLVKWGQLLYENALPVAYTANVMESWAKVANNARRRFSVHIDNTLDEGAAKAGGKIAQEAAATLLALPWELLHDGTAFLFRGQQPASVRRSLPSDAVFDAPVIAAPVRILLVTPRPEDDSCSYIDHRAGALPLADAMEMLPGLVEIHMLNPATLSALRREIERAQVEGVPYHVVHFDGHGIYDRRIGLGSLCFEHPDDIGKLNKRRHVAVFADELGSLLHQYRIPLVSLDVCRSTAAEQVLGSVASGLLNMGVASVVAMSHSVLTETTRKFIASFYAALAAGKPVGDAMLAGLRELKEDTSRGQIFGAGELHLEDWFVPILFQQKEGTQLFKTVPAKQTIEDFNATLATRLGELPSAPNTGFIGRSRELLVLQRLLHTEPYAVIRGQGKDGKTTLAAEFARWMIRSRQIQRVAFISVDPATNAAAVLDAIGRQLVGKNYSVATFGDLDKAVLPVEQKLREQSTLLIIDNMGSSLLPQFMAQETPEAILELCAQLNEIGDTRLVFTSSEPLPAPFDARRNRCELYQLDRQDAVSS